METFGKLVFWSGFFGLVWCMFAVSVGLSGPSNDVAQVLAFRVAPLLRHTASLIAGLGMVWLSRNK